MSEVEYIDGLGRRWAWPVADRDCRRVIFSMAPDLDIALAATRGFRAVVQAGGNMGVWPWLLAAKFDAVYTFEPDPACFRCLAENVREDNVVKLQAALGQHRGPISMANDHPGNLGAQYVTPQPDAGPLLVPSLRIDDLGLANCDLICLDIEGAELDALVTAERTIRRCRPVIVLEDKGLSERYGHPQGAVCQWLAAHFGYAVLATVHRDVVLVSSA